LVVGIVAVPLMPGCDPGGFVITAIIGIVGSVIATHLGQATRVPKWPGEPAGFIAAVLGSGLLLSPLPHGDWQKT
jgi:uncharacterized membrane protein YeaQ/YmgE (transglycosylase-associated protein family)